MFMVRRIIYALLIVWADDSQLFATLAFMLCTLAMLAYGLSEAQWHDSLANWQHAFNEVTLYAFSVFLLLFCHTFLPTETRLQVGHAMIMVFVCFVSINTVLILAQTCRAMVKCTRHCVLKRRRKRLRAEVLATQMRILRDRSMNPALETRIMYTKSSKTAGYQSSVFFRRHQLAESEDSDSAALKDEIKDKHAPDNRSLISQNHPLQSNKVQQVVGVERRHGAREATDQGRI